MISLAKIMVLGLSFSHEPAAPFGSGAHEDAPKHGNGWSTQWVGGGAFMRRLPRGPDFGVLAVNELGIGFRRLLRGHFSIPFSLGGAVFHHRDPTSGIRRDMGLWVDVGLRRDLVIWKRLFPFVAVHVHGRWFDPIVDRSWTTMGGVGPAVGLEWRINERAGLIGQGDAFLEAVIVQREQGRQRGNALSIGGRAALAVYY